METNELYCCRWYLIPYNSLADVVRLLGEQSYTKSNVKLGGFRSQLQASYVFSQTLLIQRNSLSVDDNTYIYIYIYTHLCMHVYFCAYMYAFMHYASLYACILHVSINVCMYVRMYIFTHVGMYLSIYTYMRGGALGVTVIVAGFGHGDTSSNPGPDWLHFT